MSEMVSLTDWFYGLDAQAARAEERTAATLERILSRPRHTPAASAPSSSRSRPSRLFVVELSTFAAERIAEANLADGHESAGPLLGIPIPGGVQVVDATGCGTGAERGPHHVYRDRDHDRAFERSVMDAGLPGTLCGDWHSHGRRDHVEPSRTDRDSWRRCLQDEDGGFWVGLICADDPSDLPSSARWAAWVTTKGAHGPACRPAELVLQRRSWE